VSDLVLGIDHVSVLVQDTRRSLDFYRSVLGLEVDPSRPDLGYPGAWLRAGVHAIHLIQMPNPDPVTGRPAHAANDGTSRCGSRTSTPCASGSTCRAFPTP